MENKGEKLILYPSISREQSGGLLQAPAHQSINVKEEIQGIALNSGSSLPSFGFLSPVCSDR